MADMGRLFSMLKISFINCLAAAIETAAPAMPKAEVRALALLSGDACLAFVNKTRFKEAYQPPALAA
jgi:hypothetical protein